MKREFSLNSLTLTLILICISFFNTYSQDLKNAIKLTESEQFDAAKKEYESLIAKEPNNGNNYYFYGENYIRTYFIDTTTISLKEVSEKALELFTKGNAAEPNNPINIVGFGKIYLYANNLPAAQAEFAKVELMLPSKKNKKTTIIPEQHSLILSKIAEAYIRSNYKDTTIVMPYLRRAIELNNTNPELFLMLGDAYLYIVNDGSKAISNYKIAEKLDPKSPKAKLRLGQLWVRAKRYNEGLDLYKEAINIDPTFAPAFREQGELYFKAGQYENAKNSYKKFLELSSTNTYAKVRYASFLFLSKFYAEAIEVIEEVISVDQSYNVLYRLAAYSYYETGQYDKGLPAIKKFLANVKPDLILISDYIYYAKLSSKMGNDEEAIIFLKKAMEKEPEDVDIMNELMKVYSKMKNNQGIIEILNLKISKNIAGNNDYYSLGINYYTIKDWVNADKAFGYLNETKPDFLAAFLWRARSNANIDSLTTEGLAKPHYELFIEKALEDTVKNQKDIVEAYEYLGYYYYKNKEYCKSKMYWEKVLANDAINEKAIFSLKDLKTRCVVK